MKARLLLLVVGLLVMGVLSACQPVQPVEAMFDFLYADPPPDLLAQRAEALALEQRHG